MSTVRHSIQNVITSHRSTEPANRSRRRNLLRLPLVALAVLIACLPGGSAHAHGQTYTYNGFFCNASTNTFTIRAMQLTTDYPYARENVKVQVELYRWNGAEWVLYIRSAIHQGVATPTGQVPVAYFFGQAYWWGIGTGVSPYRTVSRSGLADGYYSPIIRISWESSGKTAKIDDPGWCQV